MLRTVGVYSLLPEVIDSFLFSLISSFGLLILTFRVVFLKRVENFDKFLIMFFVASCISCVVNLKYTPWNNFKELIWSALSFFLIYSPGDDNEEIIEIIKKLVINLCFFMSVASIIDFIIRQDYIFYSGNKIICIGFIESRL
jgi:hypothetical protein